MHDAVLVRILDRVTHLLNELHSLAQTEMALGVIEGYAKKVEAGTLDEAAAKASALATLAEDVGAQLIAVGSYGERPLRALILGSTPPRLMHITSVPVLVVREAQAP